METIVWYVDLLAWPVAIGIIIWLLFSKPKNHKHDDY